MKKIFKIGVALLSISILPTGCLVGPKYVKPELYPYAIYRNSSEQIDTLASVVNIKWFDLFNDVVLKELITKGIENNLDMKIAVSRIERAKAELGYSKADLGPTLGYGARVNSNKDLFLPSNAIGNLSWEFDFWGKVRHENRAAQNQLLASEEGKKVIISNLVSQIAVAYFELRDYDNQLLIAEQTLETRKKSYDIINERFMGGYVSEVDKLQIEQQVAIAEASIPVIKRYITQLENYISILIGQTPGNINRGKTNSELRIASELPVSIPSSLLSNRPDVKKAEFMYIAANEKIGVAQAQRFPSFNLLAFAGVANNDLSALFSSTSVVQNVGGSVAGPIFAFGKNRRRVDIYKQLAEESKLSYEKTFLLAVAEVEQALQNVKMYKIELEARKKQIEAARKNLDLSNARYYNGYVSYLEVLEVERSLFEAELVFSQITQKQLSSMIILYNALGGGWN